MTDVLGISFDWNRLGSFEAAAVVDAAVAFPASWEAPVAPQTRTTYRSYLRRVGWDPGTGPERSAVAWDIKLTARACLATLADGTTPAQTRDASAWKLHELAELFRGLYLDHDASGRPASMPPLPRSGHAPARPHRRDLAELPADWFDVLMAGAEDFDLHCWLAVLGLTGARPSALACGVHVSLHDGVLTIAREGEKGARGRKIHCDFDPSAGPCARRLTGILEQVGRSMTFVVPVRTLEDRLARLSANLLGYRVTPMTIRAQVIGDLKADRTSRPVVAAVAGQVSTRSITCYGTVAQGRRGRRRVLRVVHDQQNSPGRALHAGGPSRTASVEAPSQPVGSTQPSQTAANDADDDVPTYGPGRG